MGDIDPHIAAIVAKERRASLISDAAVERGRVNNALDKLRQVEADFSKFQLDAGYEKRKLQQEFSADMHHKEVKIQELERLLHESEKRASEKDMQLSSATYQDKHLKDLLKGADVRDGENHNKIETLIEQLESLHDALRASQASNQAAHERIGIIEANGQNEIENFKKIELKLNEEISNLNLKIKENDLISSTKIEKLMDQLKHEQTLRSTSHDESILMKDNLDRTEYNLRFEKDIRAEREREVREKENNLIQNQLSNGMLQKQCSDLQLKLDSEKNNIKDLESNIRLIEFETNKKIENVKKDYQIKEESFKIQLKASDELALARYERIQHDEKLIQTLKEKMNHLDLEKNQIHKELRKIMKNNENLDEKLSASLQQRHIANASKQAVVIGLEESEEKIQELTSILQTRDDTIAELHHKLELSKALNEEQNMALEIAERDTFDYQKRLNSLIAASSFTLNNIKEQQEEPLIHSSSPLSSSSASPNPTNTIMKETPSNVSKKLNYQSPPLSLKLQQASSSSSSPPLSAMSMKSGQLNQSGGSSTMDQSKNKQQMEISHFVVTVFSILFGFIIINRIGDGVLEKASRIPFEIVELFSFIAALITIVFVGVFQDSRTTKN